MLFRSEDLARIDMRGVLGRAEAEFHAAGEHGGDIGDDALVVVETKHASALLRREVVQHAGKNRHAAAKLDGRSAWRERGQKGKALVRSLDDFGRATNLGEILECAVDIVFRGDAHPNAFGGRFAVCTHENDAMMARFFNTAEIRNVSVLLTDNKTKDFGVEPKAFIKVSHEVPHMTRACDVERRRGRDGWHVHIVDIIA